jgi:hypothetical protein
VKSASKRFNGHKTVVVVDQDSQVIVAFDVLAGDPRCPWQNGFRESFHSRF